MLIAFEFDFNFYLSQVRLKYLSEMLKNKLLIVDVRNTLE